MNLSTRQNSQTQSASVQEFYQFFQTVYGNRWPNLFDALKNAPDKMSRVVGNKPQQVYVMDPASLFPALLLSPTRQDHVLDLCAAPGGKSLILSDLMTDEGELVANEISNNRRSRLLRVFQDYQKTHIRVTGQDGATVGLKVPGRFTKILVDAPCSSERHLIEQNEIHTWSVKKSKRNAATQYALLCSAGLACAKQGKIVYSTCSISPIENDDVVSKFLKKKTNFIMDLDFSYVESLRSHQFFGEWNAEIVLEKTEWGVQVLPDRSSGIGPMYFTQLMKQD